MKTHIINISSAAKAKLKRDAKRIAASIIRAEIAFVGGINLTNAFGARGWHGTAIGALLALAPGVLRSLESLATKLEAGN